MTLLLGDCLKVMATLPDKSVDCFICDLPYGQLDSGRDEASIKKYNRSAFVGGGASKGCAWDVKIDLVEFWKQVRRLCKDEHTPVLMFCNTKFGVDLINSNPKWFRYDLVWDKQRGVSFLLANKMPMKSHEMVYVFSKAGAFYNRVDVDSDKKAWTKDPSSVHNNNTWVTEMPRTNNGIDNKRCPLSVIRINKTASWQHKGGHPTEKPMELYEWLLRRYVPKDGVVLDPTAGSFNSILVARKLGFKAIGIEMDNTFFWKGVGKIVS